MNDQLASLITNGNFDAAADLIEKLEHATLDDDDAPAILALIDVFVAADPLRVDGFVNTLLNIDSAPSPSLRRHALQARVDALCRLGRRNDALVAAEALLEHTATEDEAERFVIQANVASFLQRAGLVADAERLLRDVITAHTETPGSNDHEHAVALINLATVLVHPAAPPDRRHEALTVLDAAHDLVQSHHPRTLGNVWFNRAHIYGLLNHFNEAHHAFNCAEDAFHSHDSDPSDLGYVYRGRAALLARTGRVGEAAEMYAAAIEFFLDAGELAEAAETDIGLLMAHIELGHDISPERIQRSEQRLRTTSPTALAQLWMNLGNHALNRGDLDTAATRFANAHASFADTDRIADAARAQLSIAVTMRRRGDHQHALALMTQSRRTLHEHGHWLNVAHADHNLALLYGDQGNGSAALEHALRAVRSLDEFRHSLPSTRDRDATATVTYPHVFDVAIALALATDDVALTAALIERNRVQPWPDRTQSRATSYLSPRPIAATSTSTPVPGSGDTIVIAHTLRTIAGESSTWLGWCLHRGELLCTTVTAGGLVSIDRRTLNHDLMATLDTSQPEPTPRELAITSSPLEANLLALHRAAHGPLLRSDTLAEAIRDALRPSLLREQSSVVDRLRAVDEHEFLEHLGAQLLPRTFMTDTIPTSVVIAPPPALGRVPWAALAAGTTTLVEATDIVLGPPLSLLNTSTEATHPTRQHGVWIANTIGDLHHSDQVAAGDWIVRSHATSPRATRDDFLAAIDTRPSQLVVRSHVAAGDPDHPALAGLLLSDGSVLTSDDLAHGQHRFPPVAIILGCDSSGASVGNEWTGFSIGLLWAGSRTIVTTQWPALDDAEQETLDLALMQAIERHGAVVGLRSWQTQQATQWRDHRQAATSVYRWANLGCIRLAGYPQSATGSND